MKTRAYQWWYSAIIVGMSCFLMCTSSREKINFFAGRIYMKSQLQLVVDDSIKIDKYFNDLNFLILERGHLIKNYCTEKDSISVYLKINKKDTLFFVRPYDIKAVYLSQDVYEDRERLYVNFIYRYSSPNYESRPGELILEDPF
jgi:hypothetical protein